MVGGPRSDSFQRSFFHHMSNFPRNLRVHSCRRRFFLLPNCMSFSFALKFAWRHVENRPVGVKILKGSSKT